jgi:hypothetical protein
MGELVLLSIPLAMCALAFKGRSLDGTGVAIVIGLSVLLVIEMEKFYWFFLLPAVFRPLHRWSSRVVGRDRDEDEGI